MKKIVLDGKSLSLKVLAEFAQLGVNEAPKVELAADAKAKVKNAHAYIARLAQGDAAIYGVNTGFGLLSDVKIPKDKLTQLQINLLRSHACGVGDPLSIPEARIALLLRANTLAQGISGCSVALLESILALLNAGITPWIPEQGSVGASGDLAPLAHMALVLIGEGSAYYQGKLISGAAALKKANLKPHILQPKEGLALINGTQIMTAIGSLVLAEAQLLAKAADIACAMSLDAVRGTTKAFHPLVHAARPHKEQIEVAENLRCLLANSAIAESHKTCNKVQDPYSFRCAPQVHGAARRHIFASLPILETESNSVTDNPLVFPPELLQKKGAGPEGGEIISGGNFHGEYVAMAMDTLAIGLSELANISELRIQKLINPHMSGLPAFLAPDAGLNSGMMIVQVTAASLVSENKVLAHPASVDSIPTSADKEDHVSMGVFAARKARQILKNLRHVIAMELLCAAQGLEFLQPLEAGKGAQAAYRKIRRVVKAAPVDRAFHKDIESIATLLVSGELVASVEAEVGPLH